MSVCEEVRYINDIFNQNNKLIIFDLDGVLIDSKDIHYEALNKALKDVDPKYVITREDHLKQFDGLPTNEKLEIISEKKFLPIKYHAEILNKKQEYTFKHFSKLEIDQPTYKEKSDLIFSIF